MKPDPLSDWPLSDWVVRPATLPDLDGLAALAALTGGGFTNLPDDKPSLQTRIEHSLASFAADIHAPHDEYYLLVLEHLPTGMIGGTACVFSRLGARWPFYSYKLATLSVHSRELGRNFRTGVLHLVNDFDGASEVGGLFLHPDLRSGGLGRLLARSRYLLIAQNRARFSDRVIAELRGWHRADGTSPFWDGLAGRFFGMEFDAADRFNATHGNQFIADLMPRYPVYTALLTQDAQDAMGRPHDDGRGAYKMLMNEGFSYNGYIDIFDGGPTVESRTGDIRSIRDAARSHVGTTALPPPENRLVAGGRLEDFRCAALPAQMIDDILALPPHPLFADGEEIIHAPF